MKTIAFIPVRCGSKSIYLKNIRDFCGKPLVYWNIEALNRTSGIDEICVATDCNEIKDVVNSFNISKVTVYDRNPINAQDFSSTEDVMLEFIENQKLDDENTFILVQATSPLTESTDFAEALNLYQNDGIDSVLTCAREKKFYWSADGKPLNYDFNDRPRRQDFEGSLWETGAFYINSVTNIRKHRNRLSGNIAVFEIPSFKGVDLDEPDDWMWAENLMRKYILSKGRKSKKVKLFVTDVDGVLTDGGMYYSESGDEMKKFNTRDGKGLEFLRNKGIKTAIFTSENTRIVDRRGSKVKCDFVYQGLENKLHTLSDLCKEIGFSLDEVAFIGDDLNDLEVLNAVGFSATPADGTTQNKNAAEYICKLKGGEGCVREFIDNIILPALD